jgi:hypothetical protein
MEPLCVYGGPITQQEPFDLNTAWERRDCGGTKFVLLDFEHRYTDKLRIALRHIAGEAAVYMAMHGVPPPPSEIEIVKIRYLGENVKVVTPVEDYKTVPSNPPGPTASVMTKVHSTSKAKTQEMYDRWKARYKAIRAANKDMPDVAIAKKIAAEAVGKGKSYTTIRHKMKP